MQKPENHIDINNFKSEVKKIDDSKDKYKNDTQADMQLRYNFFPLTLNIRYVMKRDCTTIQSQNTTITNDLHFTRECPIEL